MAGTGLLALLDDITTLLDDIAAMTKVAAVKTAGVTGDDLAVGANQLHGLAAAREIPVVKAVAWGSLKNKAILIPASMAISAASVMTSLPLIAPLLVIGGTYLCFEGVEKILHKKGKKDEKEHKQMLEAATHGTLEEFEKKKIKGAVQTDMVLSGEIMILTLGSVAAAPFVTQLLVMTAVGLGMTVFVYGLVGCIVKMDDLGLHLTQKKGDSVLSKSLRGLGQGLLKSAPALMKVLSVAGTVAMFSVGGGIVAHHIPFLVGITHHLGTLAATGVNIFAGLVAGGLAVAGTKAVSAATHACKGLIPSRRKPAAKKKSAPAGLTPAEPENTLKKKAELTTAMNAVAAPAEPQKAVTPPPAPPAPG